MLLIFFWNLIWLRTLLHTRTLSRTHTEWPVAEEKIICVSALFYEYEFKCVRTFWQISSYHKCLNIKRLLNLFARWWFWCMTQSHSMWWNYRIRCRMGEKRQTSEIYIQTHTYNKEGKKRVWWWRHIESVVVNEFGKMLQEVT